MKKIVPYTDTPVKAKTQYPKCAVDVSVNYKLVNGQVIIDLKKIVDTILDEQEISKYDLSKLVLSIPFSLEKQVSGNSMTVVIEKKRYTLLLKNIGIIPSKQQKIDYDNTHPHRWKNPQWFKFIESLFYDAYGFAALDVSKGVGGGYTRGPNIGRLKKLKETILSTTAFPTDHNSIIEYLRWIFHNKSHKMELGMALICSDSMIQHWLIFKRKALRKGVSSGPKKSRKWD